MNTFYTAFDVLRSHIKKKGLEVVNFHLGNNSPTRVIMWVNENESGFSHFVCLQMSPTQFIIFGYDNNYTQSEFTSYDFADVNTPQLEY